MIFNLGDGGCAQDQSGGIPSPKSNASGAPSQGETFFWDATFCFSEMLNSRLRQGLWIYFGSQMGTAEGFSRELEEEASKLEIPATVVDMEDIGCVWGIHTLTQSDI